MISGKLDMDASAPLTGPDAGDATRMRHFHLLDRAVQAEAIRRLASLGWSEQGITAATQLSVQMVRRILAE